MAKARGPAYLLYDGLLACAALVVLPWVAFRSILSRSFRTDVAERLGRVPPLAARQPGRPRLLLHGVSVGEVMAMRPLVQALQGRDASIELVVSSTTPSGRETARRVYPELAVVAFPLDLRRACDSFLASVRPDSVVLMELEIWPNFLRVCSGRRIPVAIANGRITERSMSGYLKVQRFLPQFDRIALYGVQNERYAERFRRLAVPADRIEVTGNLKFDNLPEPGADAVHATSPWPRWVGGRPALACGSTHEPEEIELLRALRRDARLDGLLVLVVPRHPTRAPKLLRQLRDAAGPRPVLLRSSLPEDQPLPDGAVLLVDTFGELEAVYRACTLAFVGGSFIDHGGQNVLEPAALARPVLVGPYTENFAEEVGLLEEAGGLRRAEDPAQLVEFTASWLGSPELARQAGQRGCAALDARRGASEATLRAFERAGLLAPVPSSSLHAPAT